MRKNAIVVTAVLLSGCAGLGGNNSLSAEQMKAMASDKNATAFCGVATGPWGKVTTTYVVVDQKVIASGGFAVDDACKVNFLTNPKP